MKFYRFTGYVNQYYYFFFSVGIIPFQSENRRRKVNSAGEKKEMEKCLSMIESKVVQGLLLMSARINDTLVEKLYELNFPFVVLGKVVNETLSGKVYSVDTDNISDCMEAINYLNLLCHKRIACIHGPLNYVVSKERLDGYIEAHKNAGIPVDYSLILKTAVIRLMKPMKPPLKF